MKGCSRCQKTYPDYVAYCPRDGTLLEEASLWTEGALIRGKYRIIKKVGQGGMGAVYKALHVSFNEIRALKVMNPDLVHNEVFMKRFKHEAIFARKLQHPNAVRTDDLDEAEDGQPFIVMEFIEGQNLQDLIVTQGAMPEPRVCAVARQVAAALEAAHRLGMVHRDIKPANIVLVPDPQGEQAKVLDFGIARLKEAKALGTENAGFTLTGTGTVIGTPQYMSPEQVLGKHGDELDGRSDIYSLGVVMYQMLAGELPFKAETTMQLLLAHILTPPKPLRLAHPDLRISGAVERLVMKCLEKSPDGRPETAGHLIEELEHAEEVARTEQAEQERLAQREEGERQACMKAEAERPEKERAAQAQARKAGEERRREAERLARVQAEVEREAGEREKAELKARSRAASAEAERQAREEAETARLEEGRTEQLPGLPPDQAPFDPVSDDRQAEAAPSRSRHSYWVLAAVALPMLAIIVAGAWILRPHRQARVRQKALAGGQGAAGTSVEYPSNAPLPSSPEGANKAPAQGWQIPAGYSAPAGPASAPAPGAGAALVAADAAKAGRLIKLGDIAARNKDYSKAISDYKAALRLDPGNRTAIDRMNRTLAAQSSQALAASQQPPITPAPAASTLAPAPPVTGSLQIFAPSGAHVYVDGNLAGQIGGNGKVTVPGLGLGAHSLLVQAAGYQDWRTSISLKLQGAAGSAPSIEIKAPLLPAAPQAPATVSFPVVHVHTLGSCSGPLTIGDARVRYQASKKGHSFDLPIMAIKRWGTVRFGAAFYLTLPNGKNYYFNGKTDALWAFERARNVASKSSVKAGM
jgi:tRNA A-37 threonylcarbamoyl transferase component Bud32/tetratricopeptide (TPR) repeat protein